MYIYWCRPELATCLKFLILIIKLFPVSVTEKSFRHREKGNKCFYTLSLWHFKQYSVACFQTTAKVLQVNGFALIHTDGAD